MSIEAMNQDKQRLNGLDHLRAFAITYVFLYHYDVQFRHPHWLDWVSSFGSTGVDLFFVLSGYLIGGQLLRTVAQGRTISISDFYIKRFFRIIPAYLAVVGVYFLIPGAREAHAIQPVWKFLTFTENLLFEPKLGRAFSHAWSLCVEEHFYLTLPTLILLLSFLNIRRAGLWVAAAVFLGGLVARMYSWEMWSLNPKGWYWYAWLYYPTYTRLDGLLVGVCAAATQWFAPVRWSAFTRRPNVLLVSGLVLLVAAYMLSLDGKSFASSVFFWPLVSIAYGLVVVAAVSPTSFLHRTNLKLTSFVAAISYSLYLIHKVTIHLTQTELLQRHVQIRPTLVFLLCCMVSVAAAWILHVGVERPFMKVRSMVLKRRKASGQIERKPALV